MSTIKEIIMNKETSLGIELGSTRIKAVLVDKNNNPIATGGYNWDNQFENGVWTYSIDDVWSGIQACYKDLAANIKKQYDVELKCVGALGISAMMHGYMAFDKNDKLLVPFRTWRNTITGEAAKELTKVFNHNIPQRWSIAHLYQAILNKEEHVSEVDYLTTLSGYIHWQLTGEKVLGVGDAVGMFPTDIKTKAFDESMINKFDEKIADKNFAWKLKDILPKVLVAGEEAGILTEAGARLMDPTGELEAGITLCPPEGDAGTGMVATNSVAQRTGNVSAGTSVFAMIVLEDELENVHEEIDLVTTPAGDLVAMVHCNNCTSDWDAWVKIFKEFAESFGIEVDKPKLFDMLYNKALEGDAECGGLLAYNYFSGEHITDFEEGRPLLVRTPNSNFTLANLMRVNLFTALGALKIGLDILLKGEGVKIDLLFGHGGLFKTKDVGQKIMSAAVDVPVAVMENAGEGGAWGIAILASYMKSKEADETLAEYLNKKVFLDKECSTIMADESDVQGFEQFIVRYTEGLPIERAAVDNLKN